MEKKLDFELLCGLSRLEVLKGKNVWNEMSYLWLDDTAIGVVFQMAYLVIEARRCFLFYRGTIHHSLSWKH